KSVDRGEHRTGGHAGVAGALPVQPWWPAGVCGAADGGVYCRAAERVSPGERDTVGVVTRMSQACGWYHTGMPAVPIRWVLIRDPQEKCATQALLSTQLATTPQQILAWFVRRWHMEVTFEEARAHLGMETQRQWSEKAIALRRPACWVCTRSS